MICQNWLYVLNLFVTFLYLTTNTALYFQAKKKSPAALGDFDERNKFLGTLIWSMAKLYYYEPPSQGVRCY